MQEVSKSNADKSNPRRDAVDETRPQKGGEAATTRFGMEEGDSIDVPATGGSHQEDDADSD